MTIPANQRPGSRHSPSVRLSAWLLAVALAGSALAVGTVHTITLCVVTAVLGIAATAGWWRAPPMKVRPAATLLLFIGIGLVVYTLLQSVPVPIRWLAAIAPHNADLWSRALVPLHAPGPTWAPLTLDPIGSRIEVLKGVAYLLAFVTALRVAHTREGVSFLSAVIIITGIALALAALLHPAFRMHKLFGIYEPGPEIAQSRLAPLMNPNNLAGYLNIAFCLTLAASMSREPRAPRAITIVLVLLLGATQVWVASRGGVIAMVLGAVTMAALAIGARVKRQDPRIWLTVGCAAATLVGGILIVVGSSERVHTELVDTDISKFAMLLGVLHMLPAYGVFGAGRGAFESVFPQFRDWAGHTTLTNPENLVAQWIAEWGVPVGVVGLVGITFALRPTAALARSKTAAGASAALAAVFAQNMADFSSEIPGVMLTVVTCAAIVVAGSAGRPPTWRLERWARSPTLVARIGVAATIGALLGGIGAVGHHVGEDRRRLHDAAIVHVVPIDQMHELVRAAMLRHPGEPYFPFITALRAARARDESPLPWLGATLERARVYGLAHLLLARFVAPLSPSQARLEYRLAIEQAPEIGQLVASESPRLVGGYDDAMELVSSGIAGTGTLHWLVFTLPARLPATCVRLDQELAERMPKLLDPHLREASAAVADLEALDGAPWCQEGARAACADRALSLSHAVQELDPTRCDGYALEARALAAAGQMAKAMDRLELVSSTVRDRVTCLQVLVGLARADHNETRLDAALNEVARAGCSDERQCISNLVWVAQTHEAGGSFRRALAMYKRAYDRAPDDDTLLENVARLAAKTGLNAEALENYQQLERRHPSDAHWRKAAEEQGAAILRNRTIQE